MKTNANSNNSSMGVFLAITIKCQAKHSNVIAALDKSALLVDFQLKIKLAKHINTISIRQKKTASFVFHYLQNT